MNIARHSSHVSKPTECLRRVFVPILHLHLHLRLLRPSQTNRQQTRLISQNPLRLQLTAISRPRDESITSPLVQLVLEESGQLLHPEPPSQILARMDRRKYFLVQVSAPESPTSICKIMVKREAIEYERRRIVPPKHEERIKELELKWTIGPNDLRRKMEWLKEILEKGKKVDVRLIRRKKWEIPSVEQVERLEGGIKEVMEGVEGLREYKNRQELKSWGGQKGSVHFYFQGPANKEKRKDGIIRKGSRRMEREQEMDEKKEKRKKRAEEREELLQKIVKAKV